MSAECRQALEQVPYARFLGIDYDATLRLFLLPFAEPLVGNARLPALHGGVVGGFMETAAIIWLLLHEDQRRVPKPIDFSIDYLRSARARDSYAACEVLRQGRRIAQVSVRCWQGDAARPVAVARAHFMLDAPAAAGAGDGAGVSDGAAGAGA